jgi:adenine-specific DNA-methyltransferase
VARDQTSLPFEVAIDRRLYEYGKRTSGEVHGVVLTKRHIVEFILDCVGYVATSDLSQKRLLEPSCGEGAFLIVAVERLLASASKFNRKAADLVDAIIAYDVDEKHVETTKRALVDLLLASGIKARDASRLVDGWIACKDFLLTSIDGKVDCVVGNPPYIRIEQVAPILQEHYRSRYASIYDRADLYVAFIERGVDVLSDGGVLAFICSDRWVLNKYGAPLRRFLHERTAVKAYIDLHAASPFDSDVVAYPSIFVLTKGGQSRNVLVGKMAEGSQAECQALQKMMASGRAVKKKGASLQVFPEWFAGEEPWIVNTREHLAALRELERKHEVLETGSTRVRIGVASGCDRVFIVNAGADIEPSRLVPLVMREDLVGGVVVNASRYIVNVFDSNGKLVDLEAFPRLKKHLMKHGEVLRARHVARKNSRAWYRTIDRVYPDVVVQPKLLIPDIAGSSEVVLEVGQYHPHHNLYYITSNEWDLEVLGALLSSQVALFFVWSYATKMRGGYLRFQAQYLRRIRVPNPKGVSVVLRRRLRDAFRKRDFAAIDRLSLTAYGITDLPAFDFVDTRS